MYLRKVIGALALSLLSFGTASAQNPYLKPYNSVPNPPLHDVWAHNTELQRLHALLVIDTDSNLSAMVKRNRDTISAMLTNGIPANRLNLTVLEGNNATPEKVLAYYRNLRTGPDEAVLFYYAGHGGIDKTPRTIPNWSNGHYLAMTAGTLFRCDLLNGIKPKKPGLMVLLTDCCSSDVDSKIPVPDRVAVLANEPAKGSPQILSHMCRCLFFQHRGAVDRLAAFPGNVAWFDDQIGGWYTASLSRIFASPQRHLPDGGRGFVSWETMETQVAWQICMTVINRQQTKLWQMPFALVHVDLKRPASNQPNALHPLSKPTPIFRPAIEAPPIPLKVGPDSLGGPVEITDDP